MRYQKWYIVYFVLQFVVIKHSKTDILPELISRFSVFVGFADSNVSVPLCGLVMNLVSSKGATR